MRKPLIPAFFGGLLALLAAPALASRSSTGTYTLPAGNPYVSGTTISSTTVNATLADIASELTNSLDRTGRGAMTGQLMCSAGTVTAPGLAMGDANTGLYLSASDTMGATAGGFWVQTWDTGGATFPKGVIVGTSTINEAGIFSTGNGTGAGGQFTGGSTGPGLIANGTGGGNGITSTGSVAGHGGQFTGGSGGYGVYAQPGSATAAGIFAKSEGNTNRTSIVTDGYINLSNYSPTVSGAMSTAFPNILTPANIPQVVACVTTNTSSSPSLGYGYNLSSATVSASSIVISALGTYATATLRPFPTGPAVLNSHGMLYQATQSAGTITISGYNASTAAQVDFASASYTGALICVVRYGSMTGTTGALP